MLKFYTCICLDSKGSEPGFEAGTSRIRRRIATQSTATSDAVYEVLRKEGFITFVARIRQHTSPYLKCAYISTLWQEALIRSQKAADARQRRGCYWGPYPYMSSPQKNKSVFQWTSVPMLRGDSVNIREEGGCWGWLLRFPGCRPHLSRRAGVSFVSRSGRCKQPLGREMCRPTRSDYISTDILV